MGWRGTLASGRHGGHAPGEALTITLTASSVEQREIFALVLQSLGTHRPQCNLSALARRLPQEPKARNSAPPEQQHSHHTRKTHTEPKKRSVAWPTRWGAGQLRPAIGRRCPQREADDSPAKIARRAPAWFVRPR